MPGKSTAKPDPATDAAWYATPEGRRRTQKEFERALRGGTLIRSGGAAVPTTDDRLLIELMERAKENATRAISISLPVADLERAQQIAAQEGVGYQTVLKRVIRAGLKKAS